MIILASRMSENFFSFAEHRWDKKTKITNALLVPNLQSFHPGDGSSSIGSVILLSPFAFLVDSPSTGSTSADCSSLFKDWSLTRAQLSAIPPPLRYKMVKTDDSLITENFHE